MSDDLRRFSLSTASLPLAEHQVTMGANTSHWDGGTFSLCRAQLNKHTSVIELNKCILLTAAV